MRKGDKEVPGQPRGTRIRVEAVPKDTCPPPKDGHARCRDCAYCAQSRSAAASGPSGVRPRLNGAEASRHCA